MIDEAVHSGEMVALSGRSPAHLRAEADLIDRTKALAIAERALVRDVLLKDALWVLLDQHRWPWLAEAHREASELVKRRQAAVREAEEAIRSAKQTIANHGGMAAAIGREANQ